VSSRAVRAAGRPRPGPHRLGRPPLVRDEQLEEFRSVPSHDLRNPVTVAKGYEVAREGDDPTALDRIDAILNDVS